MAFAKPKKVEKVKLFQLSLSMRQREKLIEILKSFLPNYDVSIGYISNNINPMYGFINIDGEFIHWYEFCVNELPRIISENSDNKYEDIMKVLTEVIKDKKDIVEFFHSNFIKI